MTRPDSQQDLRPSVLDRLIDREPKVSTEPPASRSIHPAQLKELVKRDLEWLLNSKRDLVEPPEGLHHLDGSLLAYGLPDLSTSSLTNAEDQDRLRRSIESTIARFEPRLAGVVVSLGEGRANDRSLRFRIDALLRIQPTPEPVTFDSLLKLPTKKFVMQGD